MAKAQPFLCYVRKVCHFKRPQKTVSPLSEGQTGLSVRIRSGSSDFDFGLEVALTWLGQLEVQWASLREPGTFIPFVKSVLGDVPLILLDASSGNTMVRHDDMEIPLDTLVGICRPKGFYGKLARIRFTRFFDADERTLAVFKSQVRLPIESLVAVPVFKKGTPQGCLAAASFDRFLIYGSREAMVLSLAAAVYSLADELKLSRD